MLQTRLSRALKSLGCLSLLGTAPCVFADPAIHVGGEYQVNATYSNDGLNAPKASKRSEVNLKGLKLAFRGNLNDTTTLTVLYKAKESALERFYLTSKVSEALDVTLGQQKIKVYGLHRRLSSGTTTPVVGAYLAANPLTDKVAIDLTYKILGTVSLQAVEDYAKCSDSTTSTVNATTGTVSTATTTSCSSWNTAGVQKQPALAFEWLGSFGDLQPLVQVASYDLGKSATASAGLRYKTESTELYVDLTRDRRVAKGAFDAATAKPTEEASTFTGMVAYAEVKQAA